MKIFENNWWQQRGGYNSFWSLIVLLFRVNKRNIQYGVISRYEIKLPVKWI